MLTTVADLITAVGEDARLDTTALSADRARLLRWLQAGASIIALEAEAVHKYIRSEFSLAPAADSAVGVTNGDATVTGVSSDIVESLGAGDEVLLAGVSYTVLMTSGTTVELASNYAATTGTVEMVVPSRYRFLLSDLLDPFNGFLKIDSVILSDSLTDGIVLKQVTMEEIEEARQGPPLAESSPQIYAVDYPIIAVFPTPATGCTVTVQTVVECPTFADDATEILFLPEAFLVGGLTDYMMYRAMRYKKDPDARQYLREFEENRITGMPAIRRYFARVGGRQLPGAS